MCFIAIMTEQYQHFVRGASVQADKQLWLSLRPCTLNYVFIYFFWLLFTANVVLVQLH